MKARSRHSGRSLPGWGRVPNPSDWKVVDETPDDCASAGPVSRIGTQLQALEILETSVPDSLSNLGDVSLQSSGTSCVSVSLINAFAPTLSGWL